MQWLLTQMALLDAARAVASFAANWLLQSTLLIAAGLAVARLARRRGSASQSAIYRTTLAAVMVCPLATSLLARGGVAGWSVELPVAWTYEELQSPPEGAEAASAVANASLAAEPNADGVADVGWDKRVERAPAHHAEPRWAGARNLADATLPSAPPDAPVAASSAISDQEPSARTVPAKSAVFEVRTFGLTAVGITLVWLTISAVLLARLGLAWRRLGRLRAAATAAEPAAQQVCRELAAVLKVAMPEVLRTPYLASPCLAGLLRPAVLLPEADPSLPLCDVLIHELAHLRRRDAFWNLLARLAEALFFHQPLLWLLVRRLEAAAEEVCDDYVVQFGGDREQYARGLLQIAELSSVPVGVAGVAMVSLRSILARRVTRIIDSSRSLSTRAGNHLLAVIIVGGLAATAAVSFVGLGPRPSLAEAQPASDEAAKVEEHVGQAFQPDARQAGKPDLRPAEPDNQLHGRVIGADGKPVAGAKVYWLRSRVHDLMPEPPRLVATTGDDGRYHFAEPPAVSEHTPASWSYSDRIVIKAAGHGFVFTSGSEIRRAMSPPEGLFAALAQAVTGAQVGTSLPAAGEPIRGRLVDINGQPVVGATVRIRWFAEERDLGGLADAEARGAENAVWRTRAANLLNVIEPVPLREVLPSAVTDAAGRFELRDLGKKRLLQLLVQGEGIESSEIVARNEPGEKIAIEADRNAARGSLTLYPNEFVHVVGPSKPVEGRVLDFDSGEPIAGAVVRAFQVHHELVTTSREREHFAATTDAEGRYRVAGLPTGNGNKLVAFATGNVAYIPVGHTADIPVGHTADTSAAGAAVQQDFRLKRGVWAEGRVYDAETRKPFTGELSYYFFRNRELEDAIPSLREAFVDGLYWTNANGEFRVPVLPSRGILAFRYDGFDKHHDIDHYPRGFGADEIAGSEKIGGGNIFPTEPHNLIPKNYERVAEVPATNGQEAIRVEMPLFISRPVAVRVVDPRGEPVVRFQTYGVNERWGWQNQEGPQFNIQDLQPGERRKVFVFHRWRNLAGGGFVKYGEKETVEIKLVKAGSVRGRLIDADGEPIDGATIGAVFANDKSAIWAPHPSLARTPTRIPVDEEGRFRLDGLIPGWTYYANASAPRPYEDQTVDMFIGIAFQDVQVKAGENKDLGDLVVGADKPGKADKPKQDAPAQPAPDAHPTPDAAAEADDDQTPDGADEDAGKKAKVGKQSKPGQPAKAAKEQAHKDQPETDNQLRGAVIGSDGKPVAGAVVDVRLAVLDTDDAPLASTVTDAAGRFEFAFRWPRFDERIGGKPDLIVVAAADGLAPDWKYLRKDEPPGDIALKLPEEKAITGRIVNAEGRPLAGIELRVEAIRRYDGDTMKMALDDVAQGRTLLRMGKSWRYGALPNQPARVTTTADGRFRIGGLSSNTVVKLHVRGAGIRETRFNATTAARAAIRGPVPPVEPPYGPQAGAVLYGAEFDYVAEPGRRIAGTVRDRETTRPVAKAKVMVSQPTAALGGGLDPLIAQTDDEGRYAIDGCAKNSRLTLNVEPPGDEPAYFPASLAVGDAPGLAKIVQDVALVRGIELRGRIVDDETGQPLIADVHYAPLYLNKYAAPLHEQQANLRSHTRSDVDGSFRLAAALGPGAVAVSRPTAAPDDYTSIRVSYDDVVKLFEASPTHHELARSPGLKEGLPDALPTQERGGFSLIGQTGEARTILICPEERKPPAPVEVRLVRGGRIEGRVVDPTGKPLPGATAFLGNPGVLSQRLPAAEFTVTALAAGEKRDTRFYHDERKLGAYRSITADEAAPLVVRLEPCGAAVGRVLDEDGAPVAGMHVWFYPAGKLSLSDVFSIADADGRFRTDKLIPDQPYELIRTGPRSMSRLRLTRDRLVFTVGAAQTHDLGDLVVKGPVQTVSPKGQTDPAVDDKQPPNSKAPSDSAATAEGRSNRADHARGVSSTQPAKDKIVRGRVTRGGRPAKGAHVAVIGRSMAIGRRGGVGARSGSAVRRHSAVR